MPAPDTSGPSPLGRPAFLHFLFARVSASLAFQIVSVAVGWQIYELSGSALDLGLIGLAQFLPMAALTLVVGHVADRYDRRKIVAICMAVEVLATLMLAVAALHGLGGKPLIYATLIIMSSARAFEAPTLSTLIPAVVPREWLPRATALSSSGGQIAQIAGPALGGVGYGLGAGWIYCVAAAPDRLRRRRQHEDRQDAAAQGADHLAHAVRRHHLHLPAPAAAGTLSLDLFAVLLGGAVALLPIYARTSCRPAPGRWARCAPRLRRHADVADPGAAEPGQPGRPPAVQRADGVRTGHHGVRAVHLHPAVDRRAGGAGRGRRRQRGAALVAGAAEHARPHAGPRQCREHAVRQRVQPARRIRVRRDGRAGRRGAGRGDRRTGTVAVAGLWMWWFPERSCARWFRHDAGSGWPGIA